MSFCSSSLYLLLVSLCKPFLRPSPVSFSPRENCGCFANECEKKPPFSACIDDAFIGRFLWSGKRERPWRKWPLRWYASSTTQRPEAA